MVRFVAGIMGKRWLSGNRLAVVMWITMPDASGKVEMEAGGRGDRAAGRDGGGGERGAGRRG